MLVKRGFRIAVCLIFVFFLASITILADGWDSKKSSHRVLYSDTITSKTDASSVNIADELFVTENIISFSDFILGGGNSKFLVGKDSFSNNYNLIGIDSSNYLQIGPGIDGLNGIRFFPSQASDESMRLTSDGKVGIGIVIPSEKLEVNGNIKASGTICDLNGCIGGVSGLWNQNGNNIFYNNGNVGIGTENPLYNLHIVDENPFAEPRIVIEGTSGQIAASLGDQTDGITNTEHGFLLLNNDGSAKVVLTAYGNSYLTAGYLGLGIDTPISKLHINSDTDTALTIESKGTSNYDAEIQLDNKFVRWKISNDDSYYANLHFYHHEKNPDGTFQSAKSVMVLDRDGDVGIGTISPNMKLHIGPNLHASGDGALIDGVLALAWGQEPPIPPNGLAYIWLHSTDGSLKVRFSNGAVKTLATP